MAPRILPDQTYLSECLGYNPTTGLMTWRQRPRDHFGSDRYWQAWNATHQGKRAGTKTRLGYLMTTIGKKMWFNHRIAWKIMTGQEPPDYIDHRNRNGFDNSWLNLREATQRMNSGNRIARTSGETGLKGVSLYKPTGRFRAYIIINGHFTSLGYYRTKEEAHRAYCEAARVHFGEFFFPG